MRSVKKTAIVYDWIDKWGGVERVLLTLHDMFPDAVFFTSYTDLDKASWAKKLTIRTSFIQQLPRFIRRSRILSLFLYPYAFESFDFSEYDLVISVSSSFAKGVITKPDTTHIAYLLTPTRYLWIHPKQYISNLIKTIASPCIKRLKKWDTIAAIRPDYILSISQTVADRCKEIYGRTSKVIYPPFDTEYWNRCKADKSPGLGDYYLLVGRLEPYKRADIVIDVFNDLPEKKLIVIGTGSQSSKLKGRAKNNITFLENITDSELAEYYAGAQALIMPQEEDFGYVSLEAQFFGCPVIAYAKGGSIETVIDRKTGLFFHEQTAESLRSAIDKFDIISHDLREELSKQVNNNIARFERKRFEKEVTDYIQSVINV